MQIACMYDLGRASLYSHLLPYTSLEATPAHLQGSMALLLPSFSAASTVSQCFVPYKVTLPPFPPRPLPPSPSPFEFCNQSCQ